MMSLSAIRMICCILLYVGAWMVSARSMHNSKYGTLRGNSKHLIVGNKVMTSLQGGNINSNRSIWTAGKSVRPDDRSQSVNNNFSSRSRDIENSESTDQTTAKEAVDAFLSRDSRKTFIARVYSILSVQLAFTTFVTIFMHQNREQVFRLLMSSGRIGRLVPLISMMLATVSWYTIALSDRARHTAPLKWQLLSLFTIGESVLVGFVGCYYSFRTLILAMACTGITTSAVTAYTLLQNNPKYDLSQWGTSLFSMGLVFLLVGFTRLFFPGLLQIDEMVFSAIGAILFTLYLAYHTRLIVGGKHTKYKMNEKDYVFAAMALFGDIINIFLKLLEILSDDR